MEPVPKPKPPENEPVFNWRATAKLGPPPAPRSVTADKTFQAQVESGESKKRDIRHNIHRSEEDIHQFEAKKQRLEAEKKELALKAWRLRQTQEKLELELQEVGRVEAGIVVKTLETIIIARDEKGTQMDHEPKVVAVVNQLAELFGLRLF